MYTELLSFGSELYQSLIEKGCSDVDPHVLYGAIRNSLHRFSERKGSESDPDLYKTFTDPKTNYISTVSTRI